VPDTERRRCIERRTDCRPKEVTPFACLENGVDEIKDQWKSEVEVQIEQG
jgi:hypothetical protein